MPAYFIFLFLFLALPLSLSATKPLNIILIVADDLALDALSPYRSPRLASSMMQTAGLNRLFRHIETPAFAEFAKEGILFSRAYTASSICSPSRFSIMTGKYPSRSNGAIGNSVLHPNAWKVTEGMGITSQQKTAQRMGDGSRVFV